MGTVLALQTSSESDDRLLASARDHVTGTEKNVLFCRAIDMDQVKNDLQRKARPDKSIEEIERTAKMDAKETAETVFGEEVPYTIHVLIGNIPEDVIQLAEDQECEHVFVSGRNRSPVGKAIFGDIAQSVILEFDGPVTVTTP